MSRTESRCFLDMTYGAGGTVGKRRCSCLVCRTNITINQLASDYLTYLLEMGQRELTWYSPELIERIVNGTSSSLRN